MGLENPWQVTRARAWPCFWQLFFSLTTFPVWFVMKSSAPKRNNSPCGYHKYPRNAECPRDAPGGGGLWKRGRDGRGGLNSGKNPKVVTTPLPLQFLGHSIHIFLQLVCKGLVGIFFFSRDLQFWGKNKTIFKKRGGFHSLALCVLIRK